MEAEFLTVFLASEHGQNVTLQPVLHHQCKHTAVACTVCLQMNKNVVKTVSLSKQPHRGLFTAQAQVNKPVYGCLRKQSVLTAFFVHLETHTPQCWVVKCQVMLHSIWGDILIM